MIRGLGYGSCGIVRILMILDGTSGILVTPSQCLGQLYHPLIVFGQQAASSMVLTLALDRFIAVYASLRYRGFHGR